MRIAISNICKFIITFLIDRFKSMRTHLFCIGCLVCVIMTTAACQCTEKGGFKGDLAYNLVSEQLEFGPRIPGSTGHKETGDWILSKLISYGWAVEEQWFEYRGVQIRNIVGKWESVEVTDYNNLIILGAHYDTRPVADLDPDEPMLPVPGANDGASGVAVLIELARSLAFKEYPHPVWLVFFDAEDSGRIDEWEWIVGSTYFANSLNVDPDAVVIVDMVGDSDLQLYYEYNSDNVLAAEIWETGIELGYDAFIPEYRYAILDDHIPFINRGLPAVVLIDFDYPFWHTTEDTIDKVSADSLEQVGVVLEEWLWDRVGSR
jgi:glutaminyl-peptide cyclotransferase